MPLMLRQTTNNDFDPAQITAGTGLLNSNVREIVTAGFRF
jgi:hypothetical protein